MELLGLLHEVLRRLPDCLRPASDFRGRHRAAEEMRTHAFGEVPTAPRAQVRTVSTQHIRGELCEAEASVTSRTSSDSMPRAVDENQRSLFRCQDLRSVAVGVGQSTAGRFNSVHERDWLRTLRALYLHGVPLSGRSPSPIPLGETPAASTRALNGEVPGRVPPSVSERPGKYGRDS
jgi:hypothetical protein